MRIDRVKKGVKVKIKESLSLYSTDYPNYDVSKFVGQEALIIRKGHKAFGDTVYVSLDMNPNNKAIDIIDNENIIILDCRFLKEI